MTRKWFKYVDQDGQAAASADIVVWDMEDVAGLRRALKEQHDGSHLCRLCYLGPQSLREPGGV
ncbi:hypothetical protein P3T76_014389 [Phytophthora citrophthora]|uniref:Uncharacterized protein n=1 Tax=Phytophthora citrophthora TaxID=4793 RepID=A0AAD9LBB8_9STRA|nr:hypothetical protein P3T76_014389 [Phytophthora citrophthora]